MISIIEFGKAWSEIIPKAGQNVGRRADPSHPLDFFISYNETPNMQFMLLTEFQPVLPKSSQQLRVRSNQRHDGKFAVCFSLADERLREEYIALCWDIMDCTCEIRDKTIGTQTAIRRFMMWQKLFAETKEKKLSDSAIKGLIGELIVLKEICIPRYGIEKAISGWIGPIGADRDFVFEDFWYESKFISLSKDSIKISSMDQLDIDCTGYLIICRGEKSTPNEKGSFTLNELVNELLEMVQFNANAFSSIKNKLSLYGYDSLEESAKQHYIVHTIDYYQVKGIEFPRIRRSNIHPAISNGEYTLAIPALEKWKVNKIL